MRHIFFIAILVLSPLGGNAMAEIPPSEGKKVLNQQDRLSLARDFVHRVKKGFAGADKKLLPADSEAVQLQRLHDGEELVMRINLPQNLVVESTVMGRFSNKQILLSMRDFVSALDFPIAVDETGYKMNGWYIRENKGFSLNAENRSVVTDHGQFSFSDSVVLDGNDVFVPVAEVARWFDFSMKTQVSLMEISLKSSIPLPIEARLQRGKVPTQARLQDPELPYLKQDYKAFDVPFVDVTSRYSYNRPGDSKEGDFTANSSIRTSGDMAFGTLSTLTQVDKDEKVTNVRATYKKESLDPELLGPLGARKIEAGDVTTVNIPLRSLETSGLGARVTNVHPLRNITRPSTQITGNSFPGWDVELYRNSQLLAFQKIGDDGVYRFDDVDLYSSDNNFRVVLYGPQGEIREEAISIPVDGNRLSSLEGAYDISVTGKNTDIYRKFDTEDEDDGAISVSAIYERPLNDTTAVSVGFETTEENSERVATAHTGVSTTIAGNLVNLNAAVDDKGEMASELVLRRDYNQHLIRNETILKTEDFNLLKSKEIFSNQFNVMGPAPFDIGANTRYNLGLGYGLNADGDDNINAIAGLSGNLGRISYSEQLSYNSASNAPDDQLNSITSLAGYWAKNRMRLLADYQILPESKLESLTATLQRYLNENMELELGVTHDFDPKLTEGRAQVNWQAGFADISPSISYNSNNDLVATLNTRFGLAKDPHGGGFRSFDRTITTSGGISAFVFLDKDGDGVFNNEDEKLPDITVNAPQNGFRQYTDENGVAFFNNLSSMRPTDVFIDDNNLPDPAWISSFTGVSVIPREGHVSELVFPIHMSGEIDGTIYTRINGQSASLRGIPLSLYTVDGQKVVSTVSENDGFYILSKIPPGEYFLNIDADKIHGDFVRPKPQYVKIGYDGDIIYANNIYLDAGKGDVPVKFLANATALKSDADAEDLTGQTVFLNFGSYKSRVMMSLAWFKIRTLHGNVLKDVALLEKPAHSYPDIKTGKYILRVGVVNNDFNTAYSKCKIIADNDQHCAVEVLPGGYNNRIAGSVTDPNS